MPSPCIIVHGGAYAIADAKAAASIAGCENAARVGYAILVSGGSALDAVEASINCLENDPTFDAGYGSDLNSAGFVEMDAMIMDGSNLSCGSVAGIRSVRNPISVARKVMEETNHVLLVGEGADIFAKEQGFPYVETEELISPNAENQSYYNGSDQRILLKSVTSLAMVIETTGCEQDLMSMRDWNVEGLIELSDKARVICEFCSKYNIFHAIKNSE